LVAIKKWFHRRFGESCWDDGRLGECTAYHDELANLIAMLDCWETA
jgi:hypothetical protein